MPSAHMLFYHKFVTCSIRHPTSNSTALAGGATLEKHRSSFGQTRRMHLGKLGIHDVGGDIEEFAAIDLSDRS